MDIIIYGYQTNLEYFMSQVAGRVTSDYVMHYPLNKTPIRRIGVEFLGLEVSAKNLLITFFNLI